MVKGDQVARSPEQLDSWLSANPDIQRTLKWGGYGTAFSADDLLPLLDVFVEQAGGPPRRGAAPPASSSRGWVVAAVVAILVVVILIVFASGLLA